MNFERLTSHHHDEKKDNWFEFTAGGDLDSILRELVVLHLKGEVIRGSNKEYTPQDIALQIRNVILELEPQVRRSNIVTSQEKMAGTYAPNLDSLSSLNSITRASGLRSAVRQALEVHLEKPMGYGASIALDEEFFTLFSQVAGQSY